MTHKMRSTLVVPAPTRAGVATAGAILSAAIISGAPAAAAEAQPLQLQYGTRIVIDKEPTDPKVFEEQQKKLQEDLQKRADELRKKLESQGGTGPSAPLRKGSGLLPACLPNC
jgi:hypothetical protein